MNSVYDKVKSNCMGCEGCAAICPRLAITMEEDEEGFRYPEINQKLCIDCRLCRQVCPGLNMPEKNKETLYAFGGYHRDKSVRGKSTSGGAFSAIADVFCDSNYVIFGAAAEGLAVRHAYITDKAEINKFRKSKYSQSDTGDVYQKAEQFLIEGKKVFFSGTPCQIAALYNYMNPDTPKEKLLTVEVVCEGFPSPLLLRKYCGWLEKKYHSSVRELDYRHKDKNKWDFQVMKITFENGRTTKRDRWFNPFWIFWSERLMSRPSCTVCPFKTADRVADISLGDLWGVHKYCPELYGNNEGSSLVVCSSEKGKTVFLKAKRLLYGHKLKYSDVLQYQSVMRENIPANEKRALFMRDLKGMNYRELCKKWKPRSSVKLLISKYIWGSNRQVVNRWKRKSFQNSRRKIRGRFYVLFK